MKAPFLQHIKFWWSLLILCCTLAWLPVGATPPPTISNLRQQQQHIQQERQNVVQERDRLTNLQKQAQNRLTGLNQNLKTTNSHIQDSELRLKLATQQLQQLEANLAVAERSYEERRVATVARLLFLQRSPTTQGWGVLLQSENISDFISRRYQLKLVYQADQQILKKLTQQGILINQQKTDVEQQKNEIALIREQLLAQKSDYQAQVREQLLAQKSDYQAQAQLQSDLIQRLNSDRLALEAAQNRLEKDSQNLEVLIQQKVAEAKAREAAQAKTNSSTKSIIIRGTGIFAYPSNASTSSPFGWRVHPVLGYRRFHAGMDFAASYGSTIRAADSGTVIFAGWYGGYGKAVIINHGRGITTLYGHTSELYVAEGQGVQRGQAIAAVGSTGLSTGPHLHFEVRHDGTPVDPANFL